MVVRVSYVRMYYASEPRTNQTPTPFCELRAFMFLRDMPSIPLKITLRRQLSKEIDNLEDIIESIKEQKEAGTIAEYFDPRRPADREIRRPTEIALMPPVTLKVMIEGLEVEEIDQDEIFVSRLGDRYFSELTQEKVLFAKEGTLPLRLNTPYRYFALFSEGGYIRYEYDEAEIKHRLEPIKKVRDEEDRIRERLLGFMLDLYREVDLIGSTRRMRDLADRMRRLRK